MPIYRSTYFKESALAHQLLDGMKGLEVGGALHNAFGLDTVNVDLYADLDTVYKQAERFAEVTKTAIVSGNIARAKKCLALAERLFVSGSSETKNAIANVYVFSVSTFMELRHCTISNLFPQTLKAEYIKQINTSGV